MPYDVEIVNRYGGPDDIAKKLRVDKNLGLSRDEIEKRREAFGSNVIPPPPTKHFLVEP